MRICVAPAAALMISLFLTPCRPHLRSHGTHTLAYIPFGVTFCYEAFLFCAQQLLLAPYETDVGCLGWYTCSEHFLGLVVRGSAYYIVGKAHGAMGLSRQHC